MRTLPLILLLAACSGSPSGPGTTANTSDSGSVTAGTPGATPTGTMVADGEYGHVAWLWIDIGADEPAQQAVGLFGPNFDGLALPATCGMANVLCVNALPDSEGAFVDDAASDFDPFDDGLTWVGDEVNVGGFALPFIVDQNTGYAGYLAEVLPSTVTRYDLRVEGEWPLWVGEEVVPVAVPLVGLDPVAGTQLDLTDTLDLTWTPASEPVEMYVQVSSGSGNRVWRVPDNGSFSVSAADLPELTGAIAVTLARRVTTGEHDANGNTVLTDGWAVAQYPGGVASGAGTYSCKALRDANPGLADGVYAIQPDPLGTPVDVYCDMTTDGGGWTLVASTNGTPMDDRGAAYGPNLTTLSPSSSMNGLWHGMKPVITSTSDIRFTCKQTGGATSFDVDLSFYQTDWYDLITTGDDAASCFSTAASPTAPPARKNNIDGTSLPAGDQWNSGSLIGEDSCTDVDDFTVDFDDAGMDGNQTDGTDWGEDDGSAKCGDMEGLSGGSWFVFVRE